jgi:tetratricopeptide (TPR) repeat protein
MSYLENALTANPALNPLSSRSQQDVYSIIRMAETGTREGITFEGSYGVEEITEMVSVMKKLIVVREIILKVNLQYIYSAAQADEYRTEPGFKLQGSYRNMNRIAGKIMPVMNDEELKTLILAHYEQEAQTLTTGAEANLLKFKELIGWMSEAEQARWEEIKRTFKKNQLLRGMDTSNPVTQVVGQLSAFYDGLEGIRAVLSGMGRTDKGPTRVAFAEETLSQMQGLVNALQTVVSADKEDMPVLPPRMEVIARMPDGFIDLVKAQFEVMNAWMSPTFENVQKQSGAIKKLSQDIENLRAVYREIMESKQESGWRDMEKFDTILKGNPKDHATYYKRGLAWYNTGDLTRALHDFKNSLDLEPKNKKYQRIVAHLEAELTSDKTDVDTGGK